MTKHERFLAMEQLAGLVDVEATLRMIERRLDGMPFALPVAVRRKLKAAAGHVSKAAYMVSDEADAVCDRLIG